MPQTRNSHPIFSRVYNWVSPSMDRGPVTEHRRRLLVGLSGRVIEVGAGNGLNFRYYPAEVTSVLAVEPDPYLRVIARGRAERSAVPIEVVAGTAEQLPAVAASFDAGVTALVLCSVHDLVTALAEIHRVLKPGGQLRFFEHVRAGTAALQRIQRLLDATVWPLLGGGCHLSRQTDLEIERAGFAIEEIVRFRMLEGGVLQLPLVLGMALRRQS